MSESRNDYHVISSLRGGWSVVKTGAQRARRNFDDRGDAIEYARTLLDEKRSVYVHEDNGRVAYKIPGEGCKRSA